jgi:hypothetical protein
MSKNKKLLLCFFTGIALIIFMGICLFYPEKSIYSLGFLLICGGLFLWLLKKIQQIKNDSE